LRIFTPGILTHTRPGSKLFSSRGEHHPESQKWRKVKMMKKSFLLALFACVFLLGQGRANAQEAKVQFILRIEGLNFSEPFAECSGLGSQNEIIEHHIVYPNGEDLIRKIPGRLRLFEITCRRTVTANRSLWTWRKLIEDGNVDYARQNGEIFLGDSKGVPIARWVFSAGWPASLKISDKDFREEVVLTVENLERAH